MIWLDDQTKECMRDAFKAGAEWHAQTEIWRTTTDTAFDTWFDSVSAKPGDD